MRHAAALAIPLALSLSLSCAGAGLEAVPYLTYDRGRGDDADSFAAVDPEVRRLATGAPAREARLPVSLTAADGTGLRLRSLRVRGVIEGPLAFTELELEFENPEEREIEGRFEIALPDGAAVGRFAQRIDNRWQEAELVETARAREVYERHLHHRVDPALLELDAGNRFRARIYPIAGGGTKKLLIAFSHPVEPGRPYRLPLAGLPRIDRLEVAILDGDRWVRRSRRHWQPDGDFQLASGAGDVAVRAGELVMLRWSPPVPAAPDAIEDLTILVDTSASSTAVAGRQLAAVGDLAAALSRRGDPAIRVAAFDQTVQSIYAGPASGFGSEAKAALRARGPLGASNLEAALAWAAPRPGRVLLVSDGIATAGATSAAQLARAAGRRIGRLDTLVTSSVRDRGLLRRLVAAAGAHPGIVLEGRDPADWMRRLGAAAAPERRLHVAGATWVYPRTVTGVQPGDGVIAFARIKRPARSLAVSLSGHGKTIRGRVAIKPGTAALIERQYVSARLEDLQHQLGAAERGSQRQRGLHDRIVELSLAFRVETALTSYLLLPTDADYQRFGIRPEDRGRILGIDATGVRSAYRGSVDRRAALFAPLMRSPEAVAVTRRSFPSRPIRGRGGMIRGTIRDLGTKEPLAGATVVAWSPSSLPKVRSTITDASGRYQLAHLPPGRYELDAYFGDTQTTESQILVSRGRATRIDRFVNLNAPGDTITIRGEAPPIDPSSTKTGVTITREYTRSIPTGRTFASVLGTAAGSQSDVDGVSFSGSTSAENDYVVEGLNTDSEQHPTPGARAYTAILERIQAGDRRGALAAAARWHRRAPGDVLALVALGEALEAAGHPALAARAYGAIVDLHPSRAEMRRAAAARLLRLGGAARALAIDFLEVAHRQRPDHPHGAHLLALALAAGGQEKRAIEVLLAARSRPDFLDRAGAASELLAHDAGVIAAAWPRREPAARDRIRALLDGSQIMVPLEPSLRVVLSWENDATDLDLSVGDGDREHRAQDWTEGFGPEVVELDPRADGGEPIRVRYDNRAMMGYALGQVQLVSLDRGGDLRVETRPFVLFAEGQRVEVGAVPRPEASTRVAGR